MSDSAVEFRRLVEKRHWCRGRLKDQNKCGKGSKVNMEKDQMLRGKLVPDGKLNVRGWKEKAGANG